MKDLLKLSTSELLAEFAQSDGVAPSAGSAAALSAAVGAALVEMVARLTTEKGERGPEPLRARYGAYAGRARELTERCARLRTELEVLAQRDAGLVERLIATRRGNPSHMSEDASLPAPAESVEREGAELPLRIARAALEVAGCAEELIERGYQSAVEDARTALLLTLAAAQGAVSLATANLAVVSSDQGWPGPMREECHFLTARILERQVRATCRAGGPAGEGEDA